MSLNILKLLDSHPRYMMHAFCNELVPEQKIAVVEDMELDEYVCEGTGNAWEAALAELDIACGQYLTAKQTEMQP